MRKKILFSTIALSFLVLFSVNVYAQTDSSNAIISPSLAPIEKSGILNIPLNKPNITDQKYLREKETRELNLQKRKDAINSIREDAKIKIEEQKALFKEKLNTIKDERKKIIVENIDTKIANINSRYALKFSEVLKKLDIVINKITERIESAKLNGVNSALTDSAISRAKTAIDNAKIAVDEQSTKTYTVQITTDTALRANTGAVVKQFRLDIMSVHKKVVDAKQAVQNAEKELAKLRINLAPTKDTMVESLTTEENK